MSRTRSASALGVRIFLGASVIALQPACSSPLDEAKATFILFAPGTSGPPPYGDVPFPSDLYRDADGYVVGQVQGLERVVAQNAQVLQGALGEMNGFGRATATAFYTSGEIDGASLDAEGAVLLVDVDAASPERGARYPASARFLPSLSCISVLPEPGTVLAPGRRYAVVVTSRVKDARGGALGADTALRTIQGQGAAARISAAETLYGGALDVLKETGAIASASDVAGLAVFTTSNMVFELARLRDRLRAEFPAPALLLDAQAAAPYSAAMFGVATTPDLNAWMGTPEKDEAGNEWPGGDNPGGPAHDQIGAVASGAMVSPAFADPETHHIAHDPDGSAIVVDANAKIPVTIVTPKAPPSSAAGYPVVILGHGLAGDRSHMFAIANELARAGFAMAAIDDVAHGLRADIADKANNFKGGFVGPDGLPDHSGLPLEFLGGLTDAVTVRDNFRQTVLDLCSLVRMIEDPALDLSPLGAALGGAAPKLDASHIYYNGLSLGGMMGTILSAVEPNLRAVSLEVPGAGLLGIIAPNSSNAHGLLETFLAGSFSVQGDEALDSYHPAVQLMAMATEAGDPIEYAPHVFGPSLFDPPPARRPSLLVSYSIDDELMPNISTHALIRALGVPLLEPTIRDIPNVDQIAAPLTGNMGGRTGAAVQYAPSTHGLGFLRRDVRAFMPGNPQPDPEDRWATIPEKITVELPLREHIAAIVHFFRTDLVSDAAEAIVTAPPVSDYDGDGALDTNDESPFDPTSQ
jgi:dienelactone hydrolase